ncbi:opioid growth factor receptor conserved region-domain-containing protein [Hypoxylon sp. FL0890]|nr:opioid growth factor receptor conserved region-domain-containing protein [Hypoxylon sp. FL0890]
MAEPTSWYDLLPKDPLNRELLLFYHVFGHNLESPRGSFLDILRLSNEELETRHDYIQWLFPLTEESAYNKDAPILDAETILIFRNHEGDWLRENVRLSLMRMLWFFGFDSTWTNGKLEISHIIGSTARKFQPWVKATNHNHQRISRIIRSLRLLGMLHEARVVHHEFQEANIRCYMVVSYTSKKFWDQAAEGPLYGDSKDHPGWLTELHEEELKDDAWKEVFEPLTPPQLVLTRNVSTSNRLGFLGKSMDKPIYILPKNRRVQWQDWAFAKNKP